MKPPIKYERSQIQRLAIGEESSGGKKTYGNGGENFQKTDSGRSPHKQHLDQASRAATVN